MAARYVLVSGPPASGKSTLAPSVAAHLGLPLIARDTIKEALMDVLPVPDVDASRQLGWAAFTTMLAIATESPVGAVIDCNFHRSLAVEPLGSLPGPIVEVFCRCSRDEAARRYAVRAGTRHPGHFDADRSIDDIWTPDTTEPVGAGWPVLEVLTDRPVDLPAVFAFVDQQR